jgi:hypothetical protein
MENRSYRSNIYCPTAIQWITILLHSKILNGNAALSDGFRVAHSYLAKSDLDKLIIDGDKDMLKIFNSMGPCMTEETLYRRLAS